MMESEKRPKSNSTKFLIIAIIVIVGYILPWLILGILHWSKVGFEFGELKTIQFLVSIIVCGAAWGTSFHLWSRVPKLEGRLRRLFFISGFTFVALLIIFTYLLINIVLEWSGLLPITVALNNAISPVEFEFFNIKGLKTNMPADSFLTFALILFAISFYLFPIEKYVKQKLPWHTLSMLVCMALIPLLLFLRNVPNSVYILSIGTIGVVIWVIYNFIFLFYLYFSTGLKSPKGSKMRTASIMIGLSMLFIIITWISGWSIKTGTPLLDFIVQMTFGGLGVFLFNYGFYLIKPEV